MEGKAAAAAGGAGAAPRAGPRLGNDARVGEERSTGRGARLVGGGYFTTAKMVASSAQMPTAMAPIFQPVTRRSRPEIWSRTSAR